MIAVLLMACGSDTPVKPLPSRSDAVTVKADPSVLDGFCDARPRTPFAWPALADTEPPARDGWTWVNVWATWCGPCIEEMPMLVSWQKKLKKQGMDVELRLLSADAGEPEVRKFHKKHPDLPIGVRIADAEALGPWLDSMGGSEAAGLPAHFFIDREGRVDCARSGAFHKGNLGDLKQLFLQ